MDWTVKWTEPDRAYGIIARELIENTSTSRDRRSLEAIRLSFKAFLCMSQQHGYRRVHVQLLAAGRKRVFHPWMSLIQMARAYGEWFREDRARTDDPVAATIYVVDPGVISLIQGGYLEIGRELQGAPIHLLVEVIDEAPRGEPHHSLVNTDQTIASFIGGFRSLRQPMISAYPSPRHGFIPRSFGEVSDYAVREFGLVSGSTLVIDFRDAA